MNGDKYKINRKGLSIVATLFLIVSYAALTTGSLIDMCYLTVVGVYLTKYIVLKKSMQKNHN